MTKRPPPEIGQLIALQTLNVDNNKITALPVTLRNCTALKVFEAMDNPLQADSPSTSEALQKARDLQIRLSNWYLI